jgi:hypothetical protein
VLWGFHKGSWNPLLQLLPNQSPLTSRKRDLKTDVCGPIRRALRTHERQERSLLQRLVLLNFVLCGLAADAVARSPATIWKARALEAGDKVKSLHTRLEKVPDAEWNSPEANYTKCSAMLESAYSLHLTQERIVHKTGTNGETFYILLSGGDAGTFGIGYVYSKVGELVASRIDGLPTGWHLDFVVGAPNLVAVKEPEVCTFIFHLSDPFKATVLSTSGAEP